MHQRRASTFSLTYSLIHELQQAADLGQNIWYRYDDLHMKSEAPQESQMPVDISGVDMYLTSPRFEVF
jgi:hypothetical protein